MPRYSKDWVITQVWILIEEKNIPISHAITGLFQS